MKIIKYEHHGRVVSVMEKDKGNHRQHCLCWQGCKLFKPNTPENCKIAQEVYELNVKHNLTTPVFECPVFEQEDENEKK